MAGQQIDPALLRELCAAMLHDLRNPLAAVMTNLEFARRMVGEPGPDPDFVESIRDSAVACEVLRRIVSNFDVLVRAPDVGSELLAAGVGAVARDVARRCDSRAEQSGLRLDVRDDSNKAQARVDRTLLALAIENLVANSIQHAPRGSTVVVSVTADSSGVTVEVADEGAPVPAELRELALSPEGQRPQTRKQGSRYGRGLGLWAAGIAARAAGAELELAERDGRSRMLLKIRPSR
jgi:signal transduction histidine kinase